MEHVPLLIDFTALTSLLREENRISTLPIVGNGPPGTFVLFPNGLRVSLPTDQIVFAEDGRRSRPSWVWRDAVCRIG